MAKRRLTIQLDESLIRRAKMIAAKHGMSVSGLVARELEELVDQDARFGGTTSGAEEIKAAGRARGGRTWRRDELHER